VAAYGTSKVSAMKTLVQPAGLIEINPSALRQFARNQLRECRQTLLGG